MGFKVGGTELPTAEEWKLETPAKNKMPRPINLVKLDNALDAVKSLTGSKDMLGVFIAICELYNTIQAVKKSDSGHANNLFLNLNKLELEVIKARRYYAATGPLINTILSKPSDVFAARAQKQSDLQLADMIYSNFVIYAKAHWSYVASGSFGGEDVLAGRASAFPCGGIATALRIVFMSFFGTRVATKYITISTYLITKSTYHCFDAKVIGNVKSPGPLRDFNGACIFNMHFYLEFNAKYYDPCMDTTYTDEDEVVDAILAKSGGGALVPGQKSKGHPFIYVHDQDIKVSGFNGGWVKFRIDSFANSDELWELVKAGVVNPRSKQSEMKALALACGKVG